VENLKIVQWKKCVDLNAKYFLRAGNIMYIRVKAFTSVFETEIVCMAHSIFLRTVVHKRQRILKHQKNH
jgi:hypothetical protein